MFFLDNKFTRGLNLVLGMDAYVCVLCPNGKLNLASAKQKLGRGSRTQGAYKGYVALVDADAKGLDRTAEEVLRDRVGGAANPWHTKLAKTICKAFDESPMIPNGYRLSMTNA